MAVKIDKASIEQACKEIIETILICLPNAYKGSVYRIGKPPEMIAERSTCGIIDEDRMNISWDLPVESEYYPPGKKWGEYMDRPSRPLEAMAWCVEKQKSWTAEDPENDIRSSRVKTERTGNHFQHMEPVLIHKDDLYPEDEPSALYPEDSNGKTLWQDSEYAVVSVIKIHFKPGTIKIGSHETKVIKRLSRALGTELLSYKFMRQSLNTISRLASDKVHSCNILAHSLRNTIAKSGLVFSLIKSELSFLRQQWEDILLSSSDLKNMRQKAINSLNNLLEGIDDIPVELVNDLYTAQNRFLGLFLPPVKGETWIRMRIEDQWNDIFEQKPLEEKKTNQIRLCIDEIKKSLYLGQDEDILSNLKNVPYALQQQWIKLIYSNVDSVDFHYLDKLINILEEPALALPFQEKSKKSLTRLKALAETMGQLEEKTNVVLREVLNGQ